MMILIVAFFLAIIMAVIDGSTSSFFANSFIILVGSLYSLRFKKDKRGKAIEFFSITFIVYTVFSYVVSLSFTNGVEFYMSDPANYLLRYLDNQDFSFDVNRLIIYFSQSEGKDVLYHEMLHFYTGIGNTFLGGTTVYYVTLLQTLFGLLSCMTLYLILERIYDKKAYKYSIVFSICSLFLLYSGVIVRDIIIAYFFLESIRIVLDDFKSYNIFILLVLAILAAGIRMLSGVFLSCTLLVYIYVYLQNKRSRAVLTPLFLVLGATFLWAFISTVFFDNSVGEIEERTTHLEERVEETSGLFNMLLRLPPGIRQISIALFSQIAPFPSYGTLIRANTFSHYLIGIDVVLYELFWYFVFYTLLMAVIFKRFTKQLKNSEFLLFIMAIIFIIALTAHPDIRRMMPVYPIIYILYLKAINFYSKKWRQKTTSFLSISYLFLLIVYIIMKGV